MWPRRHLESSHLWRAAVVVAAVGELCLVLPQTGSSKQKHRRWQRVTQRFGASLRLPLDSLARFVEAGRPRSSRISPTSRNLRRHPCVIRQHARGYKAGASEGGTPLSGSRVSRSFGRLACVVLAAGFVSRQNKERDSTLGREETDAVRSLSVSKGRKSHHLLFLRVRVSVSGCMRWW
jgi:hypothetical protein